MVEAGSRLLLKERALPPAGLQEKCGRVGFIVRSSCLLLSLLPACHCPFSLPLIVPSPCLFRNHRGLVLSLKPSEAIQLFLATIALSAAFGQLRLRLCCTF